MKGRTIEKYGTSKRCNYGYGVERRKGAVVPHRARTGYGTGNLCKWKNGRSEATEWGGILRKIKQDKIFWYYLLTYLVVLFIPMLICCFYYIYMLSLIAEDDIRAKESELSHAVVLVDNVLDEFEYLGDSIAANSYVNGFSRRTNVFDYPNTYRVYELRASLPDLYLSLIHI